MKKRTILRIISFLICFVFIPSFSSTASAVASEISTSAGRGGTVRSSASSIEIPSDVYKIKDNATGWFLDVIDGGVDSGTGLQLAYGTNTDSNRSQLFKVEFVDTDDGYTYHVVRSLTNNALGLTVPENGGAVTISTLPSQTNFGMIDDEEFEQLIVFEGTISNCQIKAGGANVKLALSAPSNAGEGSIITTEDETNTERSFSLVRYTGDLLQGITWVQFAPKVLKGESFTYQAVAYTTLIGFNSPVIYTVQNADGATGNHATINHLTGQLTANTHGQVTITASAGGPISPSTQEVAILLFEEQIAYTIKNVALNEFVKPEVNLNFANVCSEPLNQDNPAFLWEFIYVEDGYYHILNSATGKYLTSIYSEYDTYHTAHRSYPSEPGYTPSQIEMQLDQFLWRFELLSDGSIRFQNKYYVGTNRYLSYFTTNEGYHYMAHTRDSTAWNWEIDPLTMEINVLYDPALVSRFASKGYDTLLENTFSENSLGLSVASVFKERFGIHVVVNMTTTPYESYPYKQNCAHKNQPSTWCLDCKNEGIGSNFWDCKDHHHKNEHAFLNELPNILLKESTQINILFTGHKACFINEEDNTHGSYAAGWAKNSGSSIVVYTYSFASLDASTETNYDNIIQLVNHEILHNFGVRHCENSCILKDWEKYSVTYSEVQELKMCTDCQSTVLQNRLWLYYHGKS